MACEKQYYTGITQEVWDEIKRRTSIYGVTLNDGEGSASAMGFSFSWNYDAETESGWLQCTAKPFFVACGMVEAQVKAQVLATGAVEAEAPVAV